MKVYEGMTTTVGLVAVIGRIRGSLLYYDICTALTCLGLFWVRHGAVLRRGETKPRLRGALAFRGTKLDIIQEETNASW
ncbi:hypothetical protein BJX62DRAFT_209697 [Aspergillus germanicus]